MKACIIAIVFVLTINLQASAAEWPDRFRSKDHPEAAVNPALQIMLTAPGRYYAVFGRWPTTWQEVRDSGMVQAPLYLPTGQVVDPDSREWLPKNLRYVQQGGSNPEIWVLDESTGTGAHYHTLVGPGVTWTQFLQSLPESGKIIWAPAIHEQGRLIHFGIITLLNESIRQYIQVHGFAPATFSDLLTSDLTPIDENSINPLTGTRFYGDGRPNDFMYSRGPENRSYKLRSVAADGSTPWYGSYL